MGQELLSRSGSTPTPLWSTAILLEQPDLVEQLHVDFIHAGAQVITVNAYTSTPLRLELNGIAEQFASLQKSACLAACQARDRAGQAGVRIAGCLPPLVASYRVDQNPDRQASLSQYRQICEAQSPHVDLFLCETMASSSEALAAAQAGCETGLPVWVALTLDDQDALRLRGGEMLSEVIDALRVLPLAGLLLNCSRPETIDQAWSVLQRHSGGLAYGAYANGFTSVESLKPGGTVSTLEARKDLAPEAYAEFAMGWVRRGANLIGGCCEVGPDHIAFLNRQLHDYQQG